jgi:hypothetical protein
MAKVIVERPRYGSHMRGGPKMGRYRDQRRLGDALPRRESIKHPYGHTKSLNEHLGPLRRYLDSQVGQPWDRVFAEICKHIRCDSAVQSHVRDHVMQFVQVNTILINGVPCSGDTWGYGRPLTASWRWRGWYVCPLSGILKRVERRGAKSRYPRPEPEPTPAFRVDERHYCKVLDGRWWLVEVRRIEPPAGMGTSHLEKRRWEETHRGALREYGAVVEVVSRRPLSKREMFHLPVPIDLWKQRRWWTKPGKARRA